MAARRGSAGDAISPSRFMRSLSATRKLFKGENLDQSQDLDEILSATSSSILRKPAPFDSSKSKTKSFNNENDSDSDQDAFYLSEVQRKSRDRRSLLDEKRETLAYLKEIEKREKREALSKSEKDKIKNLQAIQMEYTRSNPLGNALLDMAADNMALHQKMNFKESTFRVGDLCAAFYEHMELEKDKMAKSMALSTGVIEQKIIEKEFNSYSCAEHMPAPTKFSDTNVLISAHARSDAIRVFPTKTKFNGTENNNGMNIHEFLSLVNAAQKQMNLSREEFLEFLLMTTTGKPHVLIKDWSENGNDIESIYYNLFVHYDMRMSPETAREKLFAYKARKNSSLSKVTSDIMQLALRAACVHPQGLARTACYNNDAIQSLIRSLPPMASDTASNKYYTLTSWLNRPATFVELSRALAINTHVIDAEIAKSGVAPSSFANKLQGKNNGMNYKNKKPAPQQAIYAVNTRDGQQAGPVAQPTRGKNKQQIQGAQAFYTQPPPPLPANVRGRGGNNVSRGNARGGFGNRGGAGNGNRNSNGYSGNRGNNGNKRGGNRFGNKSKNYCSLCGFRDHLATEGCPNIQDDQGKILSVHPSQNTCPDCPPNVQPRLNHSAAYCPFRVGGPLHGTK